MFEADHVDLVLDWISTRRCLGGFGLAGPRWLEL